MSSRAQLLGEAAAWQLAADVVQAWDADLSVADRTPNTVTEALLGLAGECAEHLVEPGQVAAFTDALIERIEQLPAAVGDPGPGEVKGSMRDRVATIRRLRALVPLVERYGERKRELGVLDFGDQVALAARLASSAPEVAAGERARFRVVLLDEYQDTSHAQLVLLRSLFGNGHCVTAVGDPHQSIYGWRGASAGNLEAFPQDFPVIHPDGAAAPASSRYLSTSWRNDAAVLAAANRVAEPLRRPPSWVRAGQAVGVPALRGRPGAGAGRSSSGGTPPSRTRSSGYRMWWRGTGGRAGRPAGCRRSTRRPPRCSAGSGRSSPWSRPPCARGSCRSRWWVSAACCTCRRWQSFVPHWRFCRTRPVVTRSSGCSRARPCGWARGTSRR